MHLLGQPIAASFSGGKLLTGGSARGEGSITLHPTSMTIDAEWAGITWSREARVIRYKEMLGRPRPAPEGLEIPIVGQGLKGITTYWLHAKLAPLDQPLIPDLLAYLGERHECPECLSCGGEIDLATRKCKACGVEFTRGARKRGLVTLAAGVAVGGAAYGLLRVVEEGETVHTLGIFALMGGVIAALMGLLTAAGGKGLRG